MPDITMCQNHKCPKRETCYRYTAEPSNWQSYTVFTSDTVDNCYIRDYNAEHKKRVKK